MLIEILLRLPVKSLARFKCVSKSWLSLISDLSFARSHYNLALKCTDRLLLSTDGCCKIASIDFNAPSLHDYITKLFKPPIPQIDDDDDGPKSGPLIFGSYKGFILFLFKLDLYIWNPCIGLQRRIPSPPSYVDQIYAFIRGFGYDSSTDDYLVILGSYDCYCKKNYVVILSVRANLWKEFDGIIPGALNCHNVDPTLGGCSSMELIIGLLFLCYQRTSTIC